MKKVYRNDPGEKTEGTEGGGENTTPSTETPNTENGGGETTEEGTNQEG